MAQSNSIIRQARNAIDLILNGAVRQIESQYDLGDETQAAQCNVDIDELMANAHEEVSAWDRD